MEQWEYKVLYGLSEDELNKWGAEGYEIDRVIPPPPLMEPNRHELPVQRAMNTTIILKRRKP
jgi:hypothetical protein